MAPSAYWQRSFEKNLLTVLEQKVSQSKRVRADDTAIVMSINDRSQRDLTKDFNKTDIVSTVILREQLFTAFIQTSVYSGTGRETKSVCSRGSCFHHQL